MRGAEIGGIVFRVDGELRFLPATIAVKAIPTPNMARVPGGPAELRGVALVDGEMIPVVEVSSGEDSAGLVHPAEEGHPRPDAMLVCRILGECVGLVGIHVVGTGRFESCAEHGVDVKFGTATARAFDVGAVIAKVREGRWAV